MAIVEQPNKFSANEPAPKEFAHEAKRYLVADRVCEGTGRDAIGVHPMRVFPAAKRARNLNVAKLAAFNVIAVLKNPANSERAEANAQDAAIAVVDSRRSFDDFYRLPGRYQSLKRSWFRMPAKNLLGRCFHPRLRYELNFVRHCFECSLQSYAGWIPEKWQVIGFRTWPVGEQGLHSVATMPATAELQA
jgi:hypothetical protein